MRGRARRRDEWGRERIDAKFIIQTKERVRRSRLRASGRGVEGVDESLSSSGNVVIRGGGVSGCRDGGVSEREGERL